MPGGSGHARTGELGGVLPCDAGAADELLVERAHVPSEVVAHLVFGGVFEQGTDAAALSDKRGVVGHRRRT